MSDNRSQPTLYKLREARRLELGEMRVKELYARRLEVHYDVEVYAPKAAPAKVRIVLPPEASTRPPRSGSVIMHPTKDRSPGWQNRAVENYSNRTELNKWLNAQETKRQLAVRGIGGTPQASAALERHFKKLNAAEREQLKRVLKKGAKAGLRAANRFQNILEAAELAGQLLNMPSKVPARYLLPDGAGWTRCYQLSLCTTQPLRVATATSSSCHGLGTGCLTGQGNIAGQALAETYPMGTRRLTFITNPNSLNRIHWVAVFVRPNSIDTAVGRSPVLFQPSHTEWAVRSPLNPNLHRLANPTPQPIATPIAREMPVAPPRLGPISPADPEVTRIAVITSARPATSTRSSSYPPRTPPRIKPHTSEPDPPFTRTRKARGSRKLGVKVAKMLDHLSEGSEAVSAIYDALPEDVKDNWQCDQALKRAAKFSSFGDDGQAGQYGLQATDCHLRAIYHNAHRIDMNQAFENLAQNQIVDRVVGLAMQHRNRLIGRGTANRRAPWFLNK